MQDRFSRNIYFYESFKYDVEGSGSITGHEYSIALLIFESIHVIADGIALLRCEILENRNFLNIRFGNLVVVFHHFPLNPQKDVLAQTPKNASFSCSYRGRTRRRVDDCQLSEKVSFSKSPSGNPVNFDLNLTLKNDEKHACWRSLLEHIFSSFGLICLHGVCQFPAFLLGEFKQ